MIAGIPFDRKCTIGLKESDYPTYLQPPPDEIATNVAALLGESNTVPKALLAAASSSKPNALKGIFHKEVWQFIKGDRLDVSSLSCLLVL